MGSLAAGLAFSSAARSFGGGLFLFCDGSTAPFL
jgi:hypothetical protein